MRLSELMSRVDLSVWPQAAMILFLGVFVAVMIRTFRKAFRDDLNRGALIPFEDGTKESAPAAPRGGVK